MYVVEEEGGRLGSMSSRGTHFEFTFDIYPVSLEKERKSEKDLSFSCVSYARNYISSRSWKKERSEASTPNIDSSGSSTTSIASSSLPTSISALSSKQLRLAPKANCLRTLHRQLVQQFGFPLFTPHEIRTSLVPDLTKPLPFRTRQCDVAFSVMSNALRTTTRTRTSNTFWFRNTHLGASTSAMRTRSHLHSVTKDLVFWVGSLAERSVKEALMRLGCQFQTVGL